MYQRLAEEQGLPGIPFLDPWLLGALGFYSELISGLYKDFPHLGRVAWDDAEVPVVGRAERRAYLSAWRRLYAHFDEYRDAINKAKHGR